MHTSNDTRTRAELAIAELITTHELLEASTAAITAGLHAQTIGADDVFLMLRAVADRQARDLHRIANALEVHA